MIRTSRNSDKQTCRPKWRLSKSLRMQWSSLPSRRRWSLLPAKPAVQSRHKAIFYRSKTTWRSSRQFQRWESWSWRPKMFHSRLRGESCWKRTRSKSTRNASSSSRRSRRLPSQEWRRQLLAPTRSQCLSSKHQLNTTCLTQNLPRRWTRANRKLWLKVRPLIKTMRTLPR